MTDDFDVSLRRRLERLAAIVPVSADRTLNTVPSTGVRTRAKSRLAAGLLPVLAVAAIGTLLVSSFQSGPRPPGVGDASSDPGPGSSPISATTRSGDFELTISSRRAVYEGNEPIEIGATLTYVGPDVDAPLAHAAGAHQSPIGFGITEPVLGDLHLATGWDASCSRTSLTRGEPLSVPFQKSAAWSADNPRAAEYRDFVLDPVLRLGNGTWHVFAIAEFSIGECSAETTQMRADIEVTVVDARPMETPTGRVPTDEQPPDSTVPPAEPVVAEHDIGDFRLELRSTRAVYATGEAIELSAAYTYLGSEPRIQIAHFSPEMSFAILQLGVTNPAVTWAKVYDSACQGLSLERGTARSVEMTTHNLMQMSAATLPGGFEAMLDEGSLRLPAGRWRITAGVSTSIGTCEDRRRDDRGMSASIEIVVTSNAEPIALTTVPAGDGACMEALGIGVLAINERTGLGWVDPSSGPIDVIWPAGFTARFEHGLAVLIDASGRIVAREGDPIRMGGGYVDDDRAWAACELDPFTGTTVDLETATEPEDCRPGIGSRIGTLDRAAETGLGVANAAGEITPVRWPLGYSARSAPDRLVLFDADGNVVAWEGAPIGFSEQYSDDGTLRACADVGRVMASS